MIRFVLISILIITGISRSRAQGLIPSKGVKLAYVGKGWANNSVNAVVFRKNSLVSFRDTQFVAYYDEDQYVVLGKRAIKDEKWTLKRTPYRGNAADAHNSISIMVDGDGYLHMSWDHHGHPLRYCRSVFPGSLELTGKMPMTGTSEENVTYPEFYKLPNGNLLFLYRNGASGRGDLVMNSYNTTSKKWTQLHTNLIDGEAKRNAYCQSTVDKLGTIHISWVWRESPDVASNHDMAYARSRDGGITWEKSTGEKYILPITKKSAEYAWLIPQKSELINQTSMSADDKGNPYIATYWREDESDIPQYQVIYHNGQKWERISPAFRNAPFSLSGVGTKSIPISRPQVMVKGSGKKASLFMLFRDEERGRKVSLFEIKNIGTNSWKLRDLSKNSVGSWEPSYDTELWRNKGVLHVFIQKVEQVDGEGNASAAPRPVEIMEIKHL